MCHFGAFAGKLGNICLSLWAPLGDLWALWEVLGGACGVLGVVSGGSGVDLVNIFGGIFLPQLSFPTLA